MGSQEPLSEEAQQNISEYIGVEGGGAKMEGKIRMNYLSVEVLNQVEKRKDLPTTLRISDGKDQVNIEFPNNESFERFKQEIGCDKTQ